MRTRVSTQCVLAVKGFYFRFSKIENRRDLFAVPPQLLDSPFMLYLRPAEDLERWLVTLAQVF